MKRWSSSKALMRLVKQMIKQKLWLFVGKKKDPNWDRIISRFTIYMRMIPVNEMTDL